MIALIPWLLKLMNGGLPFHATPFDWLIAIFLITAWIGSWVDAFDGHKYVESMDGKVWTFPEKANFPFSAQDNAKPTFFADANGAI